MAVHLTRIYTRTGDAGTTALGDGSRVAKTDPRIGLEAMLQAIEVRYKLDSSLRTLLRDIPDTGHLELRIEVDGGITEASIVAAAEAGADAFVAGTAVYGAGDPAVAVRALRGAAETAVAGG